MKLFLISFVLMMICMGGNAQQEYISPKLEKNWESAAVVKVPESVLFYPEGKVLYISNINGKPSEKDGNGFISKVSPDGRILDPEWAKGLDAPKGMGIFKGKLYVTNITELVEIDLGTGKIVNRYPVKGSSFLNDVAVGPDGTVYFSDSGAGKIFSLKNGKVAEWQSGADLAGCNGLFTRQGFLYAGTSKSILKADTRSGKISVYATGTGSIDGLEDSGRDSFIYSDWAGSVYEIREGGRKNLLLNTSGMKINAADIGFDPVKKTLYVPTFFDNRVMSYSVKQ